MSKPETLRPIDSKQERLIMSFLSQYLYSKIYPEHQVIEDRDLQLKGCDIAIPNNGGFEYHDAKAQASKSYINHPRPTFAFELLFDSKDSTYTGWFLRDDLLTDVYTLVWVNSANTNQYGYIDSADDINELEVIFLDKQDIKNYVNRTIYDDALYNTAQKMRQTGTSRLFVDESMYLYYSDSLNEKPVNLVVKKYVLDRLAYQHFVVRKDSIKSIT